MRHNKRREPIVVSLAVMGCRVAGLEHTLLSIIRNTLPPDYLYVYYSKEPFLLDPGTDSRQLDDIQKKLLKECTKKKIELKCICTPNIGSFRKLIPVLQTFPHAVIITVDDDRLYDPQMIETYYNTFQDNHCIVAARVREINFDDVPSDRVIQDQPMVTYDMKSIHALPQGCGGILYHTSMFDTSFLTFDCTTLSSNILRNDDFFFRFHTYTKGICVMRKEISYDDRLYSKNSLYHKFNRQLCISKIIDELKSLFSDQHEKTTS